MLRAVSRVTSLNRTNKNVLYSTTSSLKSAYDSDGKTTVTMLNQEPGLGVMIDTFSQAGFRLNNGMFVVGPMIVFPKTAFSWNVRGDDDISEKSLVLFSLLEPKLVGYGNTSIDRRKLDNTTLNMRRRRKNLNIEILPTEKAATTYNFIVAEGRFVAAALVPPMHVSIYDEDLALAKLKRKQLYALED